MAINPSLTSTVRVGELPPLTISLLSKIPHEIEDNLYYDTIQGLVNLLTANANTYQYELKSILAPNGAYITDNFDMLPSATTGLGKDGGLWNGWAICNGNNGTYNLDGQALIGYGSNYATVGQFVGSADAVLVEHTHTYTGSDDDNGDFGDYIITSPRQPNGLKSVSTVGTSGIGKNMPPSMVVLIIMKL